MKRNQIDDKRVRDVNDKEYGYAKILNVLDEENGRKKIIFSFRKNKAFCLGVLISHSFFDAKQTMEWVALTKRFLFCATSGDIAKRISDAKYIEKHMSDFLKGEENAIA